MNYSQEEKQKQNKKPHNIIIENRKFVTISGVLDIDSFDEQMILLFTDLGDLEIKGTNLHINKLNVDTGEVNVEGEIYAMVYNEPTQAKGGFLNKLFK